MAEFRTNGLPAEGTSPHEVLPPPTADIRSPDNPSHWVYAACETVVRQTDYRQLSENAYPALRHPERRAVR